MITEFREITEKSMLFKLLLIFVSATFVITFGIGGFFGESILNNNQAVDISNQTKSVLQSYGINQFTGLLPIELFNIDILFGSIGFIFIMFGGFLIGFGTRYANGCTSGHAISGLSDLQVPSLIAVIGFFVGGLLMITFLFPLIFKI